MALLQIEAMRAGYEGIPVVFGIDLEVEEGTVTALLGSNGAGKTTTLRAVSGMVRPMSGAIWFDDRQIAGMPAEKIARLGLVHVPEGRGIFPSLSVEDSLRLAASLAGVRGHDAAERIDEAYATFPRLDERKTQAAGTLSGGEQQMLALARGLIQRPRLLMVDEMSQGLAPTIVNALFDTLRAFTERGTSVLLVEQFVSRALGIAQRAYVLEKGNVVFAGDSADLAENDEFVRSSYLGEAAEEEERPAPPADGPGEEVEVHLPPVLLRSLEERAQDEGVAVDDVIREIVESGANGKRRRASRTGGRRAS